jgi:two-component system CheB/CheR fusion protein
MVNSKSHKTQQKVSKATSASVEKNVLPESSLFPIVGIGASAGGLEAIEQFISNVPENSGMAYVVVQHLDPTQKGMLPELIQRVSKMKVFQVKDKLAVKQNCVYVIPPNTSMSILNGTLRLSKPIETRGLRLPIDFFLRSLADDRQELSVGLILSGMGSDGSSGLGTIKERNGIVMVQDPATAKFDSMPRNAMDSVQVDIVAPANELAEKLVAYLKHIPFIKSSIDLEVRDKSSLEKIIILLRTYTGNDFTLYKKSTIYRRIERRMGVHKIDKISSYVHFLHENPKEIDILFKELLIGVTNFFRDPAVWEKFGKNVLPEILSNLPAGSNLRAWVPACSTGEEAYSLAIVFKETLEKIKPARRITLQIFATDLDNDAIEAARKGQFPVNIAADVSPERLNRFFVKTDDGFRVTNEIREMVVFAQHNIIMHPPFTKIDILSCRNLLIYLDSELQKKILGLFYFSLNNDGTMILGGSETLGTLGHLFKAIDSKLKIYRRTINALAPDLINFPSSFARCKNNGVERTVATEPHQNIQTLADQLLLQNFSPPSVLVNENGDIMYISGRTGKYLEPAAGKANLNIFAMLRDGLRSEFPVAFHQAIRKKTPVVLRNLKVGTNGSSQTLNITIQWIDKPEQLNGTIMVVFTDVVEVQDVLLKKQSTKSHSRSKVSDMDRELQNTREEMQSSVEEMQASQEELKSANEELQSANEELQSTNEELTSSKEEMQSLNEELQTVNAELQAKVDEFARVDSDMKNLLNSTDIATLFLDKELNIRRYTNQATKIFKFIKSDIGRPFTDQTSDLLYPEMVDDAHEVLRTLVFVQKQIQAKDGRWFSTRIMPYRTSDDRIDGLVITFVNITEFKEVVEKLEEISQISQVLLSSTNEVTVSLSTNFRIVELNVAAEKYFNVKREDAVGNNFLHLFVPETLRKKAEKVMHTALTNGHDSKIKVQVNAANGKTPLAEWTVKVLLSNKKVATGMIMTLKSADLK